MPSGNGLRFARKTCHGRDPNVPPKSPRSSLDKKRRQAERLRLLADEAFRKFREKGLGVRPSNKKVLAFIYVCGKMATWPNTIVNIARIRNSYSLPA